MLYQCNGYFHCVLLDVHAVVHRAVRVLAVLHEEEPRILRADCMRARYICDEQDRSFVSGSAVIKVLENSTRTNV
jgi:hypothetical protein